MGNTEHLAETRRWLSYAQEDLEAAEALVEQQTVVPRHICWLAQQAAEKALKAVLVFLGVEFPRRHDLDALRNLIPTDWEVKQQHPDLAELHWYEVHGIGRKEFKIKFPLLD
jgi:HEPN domain-containing protein